jgi:dGTPase
LQEGLAKHNGPVSDAPWALAEINAAFDLDLARWPSLEAQIAAVADDIAYDNHDIDDGIRAGLLTLDQLLELPFLAVRWEAIVNRYPGARHETLLRELVRDQIGVMVNDVITSTRDRVCENTVKTVEDIRSNTKKIGGFSRQMAEQERVLKSFMYANLYHHPSQIEAADRARRIVADLFAAYSSDPALLPDEWRRSLPQGEPQRSRHISDFLAGMTDRFAVNCHRDIFGRDDI